MAIFSRLSVNQPMRELDSLRSANGLFEAILLTNGNLYINGPEFQGSQSVHWRTYVPVGPSDWPNQYFAVVQPDGNFCIYFGTGLNDNRGSRWCARKVSAEEGNYFLILQNDGNLCVYSESKQYALWCSGSWPSPAMVARALAPNIYLYSQDPHRPASVEWFLGRSQLVSGKGELSSGAADLPSGMSAIGTSWTTVEALAAASSSSLFGDAHKDENVSLFPLSSRRANPVASSDFDPCFYDYQLETFQGWNDPSGAPIYCRVAFREGYYLISYFAFYPYNGGLGPTTKWDSKPLGSGSGFGAHIGDWTRLTVKVTIVNTLVSLHYVDYEAHGDPNPQRIIGMENLALSKVPQRTAFAAWHSHELYPNAGKHWRPETGFTANDYTDEGFKWNTGGFNEQGPLNLEFISDDGPAWVKYNGLWGANMSVPGSISDYLTSGPAGPAFHWYWISEEKDGSKPIQQWRLVP